MLDENLPGRMGLDPIREMEMGAFREWQSGRGFWGCGFHVGGMGLIAFIGCGYNVRVARKPC